MTRRQTQIASRLVFLLPVAALGIAMLLAGAVRTLAAWQGQSIPDDLLGGLPTMAISLVPLGACALIAWVIARRPQRLPPPTPESIAPGSKASVWRPLSDPRALEAAGSTLGLEIAHEKNGQGLSLTQRHRWTMGPFLVGAALVLVAWIGPPSLNDGSLAFGPINTVLLAFSAYLALFCLLMALPLSMRKSEFRPKDDALIITVGRRSRLAGLSRLRALEVRLVARSLRDSEIQVASSTSWHPLLVGWLDTDQRGLTPFALIEGPRSDKRETAEWSREQMEIVAEQIAKASGAAIGRPAGAEGDAVPYD